MSVDALLQEAAGAGPGDRAIVEVERSGTNRELSVLETESLLQAGERLARLARQRAASAGLTAVQVAPSITNPRGTTLACLLLSLGFR